MTVGLLLSALLVASAGEIAMRPEASQGDIVMVRVAGKPIGVSVDPSLLAAAGDAGRSHGGGAPRFFAAKGASLALFGIDAEAAAGRRRVTVRWSDGDASVPLLVKTKKFPTEKLVVEPKYVEPPADVLERIAAEKARLDALWRRDPEPPLWHGGFVRPVSQVPSSAFGLQRIFNGQRRSPHNGVDFKAAAGVEVGAANAGRVVLCDDLYFTGNTVVVDHGLGLYTVYAHLSEISVAVGDSVRPGSVVGRVGATGRATGPHLHWGARLLEARVDPMQLLELDLGGSLEEANGSQGREDL